MSSNISSRGGIFCSPIFGPLPLHEWDRDVPWPLGVAWRMLRDEMFPPILLLLVVVEVAPPLTFGVVLVVECVFKPPLLG